MGNSVSRSSTVDRNPASSNRASSDHTSTPDSNANQSSGSAANILALQRTHGNQAVMRMMQQGMVTGSHKSLIQRNLQEVNAPEPGDPPSGVDLKNYATAVRSVATHGFNSLVTTDIPDAIGNNYFTYSNNKARYKPTGIIAAELKKLMTYGGADEKTANGTDKDKVNARQATAQYFILDALRNTVADSAGEKLKEHEQSKGLAIGAIDGRINKLNQRKNSVDPQQKLSDKEEYDLLYLNAMKNTKKKYLSLSKSIMTQIAYETTKGDIPNDGGQSVRFEDFPIIKKILDKFKDEKKQTDLTKDYTANILDKQVKPEFKLRIKNELYQLRSTRDEAQKLSEKLNNDTVWLNFEYLRKGYKKDLLDLKNELDEKRAYFAKIAATADALNKKVAEFTRFELDAQKFNRAESAVDKFESGNKVYNSENKDQRDELINGVATATKRHLSQGDDAQFLTYDAMGNTVKVDDGQGGKRSETVGEVKKRAQDNAINETLEGSMNSSLRKIGWILKKAAPLPGDKGKMEIILKVPVGKGAGYIGFRFTGQFEHGDSDVRKEIEKGRGTLPKNASDPFKVRVELAIIGGVKVPFVFDAGGELGLTYFEAESDRGAERAMELVSFGYYRRFRESTIVPNYITDRMWGMGGDSIQDDPSKGFLEQVSDKNKARNTEAKAWGKAMKSSFTDKEYVETGFFAGITGEATITGALSAKGSLKALSGKRYTRQTMDALLRTKGKQNKKNTSKSGTGELEVSRLGGKYKRERNLGRNISGVELAPEFTVGPFTVGGKGKLYFLHEQQHGVNKELNTKTQDRDQKLLTFNEKTLDVQTAQNKVNSAQSDLSIMQKRLKTAQDRLDNVGDNPKPMKLLQLRNAIQFAQTAVLRAQQKVNEAQQELLQAQQHAAQAKTAYDEAVKEVIALQKDKDLLERQAFSFDLELSGQSKSSASDIFGGPEKVAAAVMSYAGIVGSQVRGQVIALRSLYGQRQSKSEIEGQDLFDNAFMATEGLVNGAGLSGDKIDSAKSTFGHSFSENQSMMTGKFDQNMDMVKQVHQGNLGDQLTNRDNVSYMKNGVSQHAWDKANETQMKGGGGLKLLFKLGVKRDFGATFENKHKYAVKVELSIEAVKGGTLGSHGLTVGLEKSRRLYRIGRSRDKDGKWTSMTN